ncbi:hypothetical protein GCM10007385_16820 [Tateyamaria omphalii]|nr:hypothetical protein GCM10007385_16820 [Tateyamaria omphalii]
MGRNVAGVAQVGSVGASGGDFFKTGKGEMTRTGIYPVFREVKRVWQGVTPRAASVHPLYTPNGRSW